jgi:pseudouridine synthase
MRLNKFLQAAGIASRRRADEIIKAGRVTVNDRVVREPWFDVDSEGDRVKVDGNLVVYREKKVYFIFYKPRGVVSTLRDPHAESTISDFLPKDVGRIFHVGRLDKDSEGLMILTNDGELANVISHPRYGIEKTYIVELEGKGFGKDFLRRLRRGIELEDGPFIPLNVVLIGRGIIKLSLVEGRKREIRRAMKALGYRVKRLKRISIGPIHLPRDMKPGEIRPLGEEIIKAIREFLPTP